MRYAVVVYVCCHGDSHVVMLLANFLHFVVFASSLCLFILKHVTFQQMYDVKGSWIDRHTNHHVESGKLMKDQDLHKTLNLVPQRADQIYKQLKKDSKFLMQQNIMDYSVLLGIYYVGIDPSDVQNDRIMQQHHDNASNANTYKAPELEEEKQDQGSGSLPLKPGTMELENSLGGLPDDLQTVRKMPDNLLQRANVPSFRGGIRELAKKDKAVRARVIEGPGIYYLGIIDVLQEWDLSKKLERWAKVHLRMKDRDGISCVEPVYYRKRFMRKMWRIGIRPIRHRKYERGGRTPSTVSSLNP